MQIRFFLFFFLIFNVALFCDDNNRTSDQLKQEQGLKALNVSRIQSYEQQLDKFENDISNENTWIKSYASYLTSLKVRTSLAKIEKRIKYLRKHAKKVQKKRS